MLLEGVCDLLSRSFHYEGKVSSASCFVVGKGRPVYTDSFNISFERILLDESGISWYFRVLPRRDLVPTPRFSFITHQMNTSYATTSSQDQLLEVHAGILIQVLC